MKTERKKKLVAESLQKNGCVYVLIVLYGYTVRPQMTHTLLADDTLPS